MRMSLNLQKVVVEDGVIRRVDSRLEVPVLNDVLVANNNAAAAAKYIIEIGDVKEKQDSSGLWIGPPSGSSAALRSAGGKLLGITDRTFEFVTREPSVRPDRPMYAHTRGLFGEHEEIAVVSRMPRGKLFVDGEHREIDFNTGDRAVFSRHEHDLLAFIDPEINRRYSYFFGIYEKW
jgi:NAD+ kinase